MWNIIKENKYSVGLVALILVGVIAYSISMLIGTGGQGDNESPSDGTAQEESLPETQRIGTEVFQEVRRLEQIQFNGDIFNDPVYLSLRRFGYRPAPKVQSRVNPFAPIGQSSNRDLVRVEE